MKPRLIFAGQCSVRKAPEGAASGRRRMQSSGTKQSSKISIGLMQDRMPGAFQKAASIVRPGLSVSITMFSSLPVSSARICALIHLACVALVA